LAAIEEAANAKADEAMGRAKDSAASVA